MTRDCDCSDGTEQCLHVEHSVTASSRHLVTLSLDPAPCYLITQLIFTRFPSLSHLTPSYITVIPQIVIQSPVTQAFIPQSPNDPVIHHGHAITRQSVIHSSFTRSTRHPSPSHPAVSHPLRQSPVIHSQSQPVMPLPSQMPVNQSSTTCHATQSPVIHSSHHPVTHSSVIH